MMKKWYFSENGKVSGPCSINDGSSLLSKNNHLYGWNPSFSQWLPVNKIPELSELIPESKPAAQVPKELINKFVTKKRDLNKKVILIDETIKKTQAQITAFEKEISQYKSLTESLSSDMKDNILPLEKKYQLVSKQLIELTKAAEIAKHEIKNVVQEFGELVLSKTNENLEELLALKELPELKQVEKMVKTQETAKKTPLKISAANVVKPTTNKEVSKAVVNRKTTIEKVVALRKTTRKKDVVLKESVELKIETPPSNTIQEPVKEKVAIGENKAFAFVGVKNKFKSVFKPAVVDGKTPIEKIAIGENKAFAFVGVKNKFKSVFKPKIEEPTMKLSDQLKQLEQEPKKELAFIDSDTNGDLLDDYDPKKKRRRRRRS